jgi:hypothetical protein
MKKLITIFLVAGLAVSVHAQVKPSFLYSTSMPYGTLDIRTTISSTNYYYLVDGKTFSYRESSPGVRTNKYRDMTSWESSPYTQGHLRQKNGTADKFIMNFRLLPPVNYNGNYAAGYPMVVLLHGGAERGNCFFSSCFHATWDYDPNVNSPRAPTTSDHKLLNNDYNLVLGGKQHLDARNLAGSRLPNDPSMPSRAFPGFVLIPQMLNEWNPLTVQDMIRIVQLVSKKYKIDPNRIYLHGLSIGGYAVYEALKRGSWLFAAALPMSAIDDANIFEDAQQSRVINIPLWVFQGGSDTKPTPSYTQALITKLKNAGGVVKYTEYANVGHATWDKAYADPAFFSWMLSKNKSNIHPSKGNLVIVKSKNIYPKLLLPQGFFAYQWQKDGVTLSATSFSYTATAPGVYRARFSRVANPTSTQWNKWSVGVRVTEGTAVTPTSWEEPIIVEDQITEESVAVYPNPAPADNINLQYTGEDPINIKLFDPLGRLVFEEVYNPQNGNSRRLEVAPSLSEGLYIMVIDNGKRKFKERVFIHD